MGRWLEVKVLMKDVSKFRTRRLIDNLNLFHSTAHLENDEVCMAHYIKGPCGGPGSLRPFSATSGADRMVT